MKRGFYTIMAAQFFSSLADNALFVAAVELIRISGGDEWQRAALVPMFALFYVVLAPFVGAFAVGLALGLAEERAIALGCACASDSVTRLGTQSSYPTPAQAQEILEENSLVR